MEDKSGHFYFAVRGHYHFVVTPYYTFLTFGFSISYDTYARVENLKNIFLYKFKTNEVIPMDHRDDRTK